ncbi:hypothetical protein GHT09_003414 [Marmota monax]|uniref:Uncharacterized protein n=1 Tax=Marmota monax TaxID=9995 RepID=A0A834V8D3_MARMO|nr:hypothetical protein GHT09_003414 [Marmota monax]
MAPLCWLLRVQAPGGYLVLGLQPAVRSLGSHSLSGKGSFCPPRETLFVSETWLSPLPTQNRALMDDGVSRQLSVRPVLSVLWSHFNLHSMP